MTGDDFFERVYAYSKWFLGLEDSAGSDSATPLHQTIAVSGGLPNIRRSNSPRS